jgi:hypothetical protein
MRSAHSFEHLAYATAQISPRQLGRAYSLAAASSLSGLSSASMEYVHDSVSLKFLVSSLVYPHRRA